MYWLRKEQIEGLREHPLIEDVLDKNGIIKPTDQSRILSWHFGIVPWVIIERMTSILAGMDSATTLETNYLSALKPGDTIWFRWWREEPEIYIIWEKPKPILNTANVSGGDLAHFEFPVVYQCTDSANSILNQHLLQSGDFQLASGATMIDTDGNFSGHYRVPENHPFLIGEHLPFPFMKEVANQIISLSNSLTNNPDWVQTWTTILLAYSHIARQPQRSPLHSILAPGGSLIIVSGKAGIDPTDPKKRRLIAEYTAYNKNTPLYHGKIMGTKVPTKILFR